MKKMDTAQQSDKLIQELVKSGVIFPGTDMEKLSIIIRKHLCESFFDGMYHQNHKNYIEAKNK